MTVKPKCITKSSPRDVELVFFYVSTHYMIEGIVVGAFRTFHGSTAHVAVDYVVLTLFMAIHCFQRHNFLSWPGRCQFKGPRCLPIDPSFVPLSQALVRSFQTRSVYNHSKWY